MRRLKVNHEQFVVIFMAAFIVTVGSVYFIFIQSLDQEFEFEWRVTSDTQGIYWIGMDQGEPIHMDNVRFSIEKPNGLVAVVDDPAGRTIFLEGGLSEIKENSNDYRNATESGWPGAVDDPGFISFNPFYSGVSSGKSNLTLFILFYTPNNKLSSSSFFLIRSATIGGIVEEGYHLVLTARDNGDQLARMAFPHAIRPLDFIIKENQHDYRMRIITCEPWPLNDVEYRILNLNRLTAKYKDMDANEYRIEGNLSDILWDPDDMTGDVYRDIFYSDPNSFPVNISRYIVFMDSDSNGLVSSGDTIWIRDKKNGGAVDEDYRIRLVSKASDMGIVETTMIRHTFDLIWNVSIVNGTYCVDVINITRHHLDALNFNLTTPDGHNATAVGPDGFNAILNGRLQDINFSVEMFAQENASRKPNATFQDKFYASEYGDHYWWNNYWKANRTLFIILEDLDSNGRLSNGDKIWIRSRDQGGAAGPGYALALTDDMSYKAYPVIILP